MITAEKRPREDDADAPPTKMARPDGLPGSESLQQRRLRELFIGNLCVDQISEHAIRDFFYGLLSKLPEYLSRYQGNTNPVINIRMGGDRKYAFVEFTDEVIANTCMKFDKTPFLGRPINIGRPKEYVAPPYLVSLDVLPLQNAGYITLSTAALGKPPVGEKSKRELYIGQLPVGVTSDSLKAELQKMVTGVAYEDECPPVLDVRLSPNGKFAFAELRTERLTTAAIQDLRTVTIHGKDCVLGRPSRAEGGGGGGGGGKSQSGQSYGDSNSAMSQQLAYNQYMQYYAQQLQAQALMQQQQMQQPQQQAQPQGAQGMPTDPATYWAMMQQYISLTNAAAAAPKQ